MICRIGTGFSDEDLQNLTQKMKPFAMTEKPLSFIVSKTLKPDVWLQPSEVFKRNEFELRVFIRFGRSNVIN